MDENLIFTIHLIQLQYHYNTTPMRIFHLFFGVQMGLKFRYEPNSFIKIPNRPLFSTASREVRQYMSPYLQCTNKPRSEIALIKLISTDFFVVPK